MSFASALSKKIPSKVEIGDIFEQKLHISQYSKSIILVNFHKHLLPFGKSVYLRMHST